MSAFRCKADIRLLPKAAGVRIAIPLGSLLTAERLFCLVCQLICPVAVASREVKWNEAGDARPFGNVTGLTRRQMPSFGGDIGVHVEERCLEEQLVGIPRYGDHVFDIPIIVGEIDYVSDFLPARCAQGVLFEVTQRYG